MSKHVVLSPDGRVELLLTYAEGKVFYEVSRDGVLVADRAPLGLVPGIATCPEGLCLKDEVRDEINETLLIPAFKKATCLNHANTIAMSFTARSHPGGRRPRL